MKLGLFLRSVALSIWIIASCSSTESPESVAIDFLNACRDGDEKTVTRVSVSGESLPVLKWRRLASESHKDDQGTVGAFLNDLEVYRQGNERLLELAREHQRLLDQKPPLERRTLQEGDRRLVGERNNLLAKLERLKKKHPGMFSLLDAGVLPQVLRGKRLQDFLGPYDVKIYFYIAEVSSVTPFEVKLQHQVKIELTKVKVGNLETDWLVYRINDLTE